MDRRQNMEKRIPILAGEYWYGLSVNLGTDFPFSTASEFSFTPTQDWSDNQEAPLLVSSGGRFMWSEKPYDITVKDGCILVTNAAEDFALYEGYGTLRGAFLEAAHRFFPANGQIPPENFFIKPQYNTWAELIYDQSQESILRYARGILENQLPPGILMIDDGWMRYYGSREFYLNRFPDARGMIRELHEMGFEVMLWICPFISPDSAEFRELMEKDMLVKNSDGTVAIRNWWNGFSGVLDMSNPGACAWLSEMLQSLMKMGIDGFKFDAGDTWFYKDDDITYGNVSAHDQCELWARFGLQYPYNEYRACYKCAGLPLVQRLRDKAHQWSAVASLVPDALTQGILGFAYGCPDMIGGGSFTDFLPGALSLKPELFVRYAQVAALMPMMQYSAAPWRVLSQEYADICRDAGKLHLRFADRIIELAREASRTNEPILRYMEYVFPGEGMEKVTDQFMLGNDILCAPVVEEGAVVRNVKLPAGKWKYVDGTVYMGGSTVCVNAPLEVLPYFEMEK